LTRSVRIGILCPASPVDWSAGFPLARRGTFNARQATAPRRRLPAAGLFFFCDYFRAQREKRVAL